MRLRYKLWLEDENKGKAFGDGPLDMLERVDRLGSLSQAAAEMGMSYSHAWHLLRRLENALGFPLLTRTPGGKHGGGSKTTVEARELMRRYRLFRRDSRKALESLYREHLSDIVWHRG